MNQSKSIIQYDNQNNKNIICRFNITHDDDFIKIIRNIIMDYGYVKTPEYINNKNLLDTLPAGYYLVHDITTDTMELILVDIKQNIGYLYNSTTRSTQKIYKWELVNNNYHQLKTLDFKVDHTMFDITTIDNKVSSIIGSNDSTKSLVVSQIVAAHYDQVDNLLFFLENDKPCNNLEYIDKDPQVEKVRYLPLGSLKNTFEYIKENNTLKKYLVIIELTSETLGDELTEFLSNAASYNATIIVTMGVCDKELIERSNYVFSLINNTTTNFTKLCGALKYITPHRKLQYINSITKTLDTLSQVFDTSVKEIDSCTIYGLPLTK